MRKFLGIVVSVLIAVSGSCSPSAGNSMVQTQEIREFCHKAQECEKKITDLSASLENSERQAKTATPVIRDVCTILTRCFTVLFDIQRFSKFLAFSQQDNKNDFVRCSIIIKNFASYFNSISGELKKAKKDVFTLKRDIKKIKSDLEEFRKTYDELCTKIENVANDLSKKRKENVIQEDVVYHIANKSESIDELDAELEAENAVGVLRNTKISTNLTITYPVSGRIVEEFGDKSTDSEMIHHISFEVKSGAIVTSPCKGLVVFAGKFLNYGNMVIISNGEYRIFLYGMERLFCATGDVVEIGDYVGRAVFGNNEKVLIKLELKKSGESLDPRHWILESVEKQRN